MTGSLTIPLTPYGRDKIDLSTAPYLEHGEPAATPFDGHNGSRYLEHAHINLC